MRMTEAGRVETGAQLTYETEPPSFAKQKELFEAAFDQSESIEHRTRIVKGPWYDDFYSDMQTTSKRLATIDRRLTPECLTNEHYQQPGVRYMLQNMGPWIQEQIKWTKRNRSDRLQTLATTRIAPAAKVQTLPEDILDATPYARQGENWSHKSVTVSYTHLTLPTNREV